MTTPSAEQVVADHAPSSPRNQRARRAVVLTALGLEFKAVQAFIQHVREVTFRGTVYSCGTFTGDVTTWDVAVVETGEGNEAAALECERAIGFFQPDVVLFVGVAGGIKDVAVGDVVAASEVYGYEAGKEIATGLLPRAKTSQSDYSLIQRARAEARSGDWQSRIKCSSAQDSTPRAFVKPIAAGEKVLASTRGGVYRLVRESFSDAIAVEMEGRGVLRAATTCGVPALVVRGISDLIDDKAASDGRGNQDVAARNASAFAFQLLAKFVPNNLVHHENSLAPREGSVWQTIDPKRIVGATHGLDLVPWFTGRSEELSSLSKAMSSAGCPRAAVITGVGGVGKTALTRQFAVQCKGFPAGVLWLHGDQLESDLIRAAKSLSNLNHEITTEMAAECLSGILTRESLLVVVDDLPCLDASLRILPTPGERGGIIITTRHRDLRLKLAFETAHIELKPWPPDSSIAFLEKTSRTPSRHSEVDLRPLAEFTGHLPLAMRLVARLLDRAGTTPSSLLELLERAPIATLDSAIAPPDRGVMATFRVAIDTLSDLETRIFVAATVCGRRTFVEPIAWLAQCDIQQARECLSKLESISLVDFDPDAPWEWSTHDVIRLFGTTLEQYGEIGSRHDTTVDNVIETFRDQRAWPFLQANIHEVLSSIERAIRRGDGLSAGERFSKIIPHLRLHGHISTIISHCEKLVPLLPAGSSQLGCILGHLGVCYDLQGDAGGAIDTMRASIAAYEAAGNSLGKATLLCNLASAQRKQGRTREAMTSYSAALKRFRKLDYQEGIAIASLNIGSCQAQLRNFKEARRLFSSAIRKFRDTNRRDGLADAYESLGRIYLATGHPRSGIRYVMKAVEEFERLGLARRYARAVTVLAVMHGACGAHSVAIELLQVAVSKWETLDSPRELVAALKALALAYQETGRPDDAQSVVDRILSIVDQDEAHGPPEEVALASAQSNQARANEVSPGGL